MSKEAFGEMGETLGKVAGTMVKELRSIALDPSSPLGGLRASLVAGFKKGWREAQGEAEPARAEQREQS